jgi:CRP-like cAMP-binding protein
MAVQAHLMKSLPKVSNCASCTLGAASQFGSCPFHDLERPAGTILLRQGEVPQCVWFIRRGTVLLSSTTESGDETQCALRGPGAVVGLEALAARPTRAEAWALSDVALCRLDADSFRAWVGEADTPAGAVARLAIEEGDRRGHERVALAGVAPVRVARFLLERLRMEGRDTPLPVEQQVLARMLGMKPETMSRALARLRGMGAIAPGRGVRIADLGALQRAADGNPRND